MEAILTKGGASPLKRLWEKTKKEGPHLWHRIEARKHLVHKCYLSPLAYLPQRGMRLRGKRGLKTAPVALAICPDTNGQHAMPVLGFAS